MRLVLDLAQRAWHFKDEPDKKFLFKMQTPITLNNITIEQKDNKYREDVKDFFKNFEYKNLNNNEYSPGFTNKVFADSLPQVIEMKSPAELFPPMKKSKMEEYCDGIFEPIELNSSEIIII